MLATLNDSLNDFVCKTHLGPDLTTNNAHEGLDRIDAFRDKERR